MTTPFGTRKDRRVYPKPGTMTVKEYVRQLGEMVREGARRSAEFPKVIVFDWNGTVDARGSGIGIPGDVLLALKSLGKIVVIYTSSVDADRKVFMRKWCQQNGIPFTDRSKILDNADMFIGDKPSDERRAGRHGINFVYTKDFDMAKVVPKLTGKSPRLGSGAGVLSVDGTLVHHQDQQCTCDVMHPGQRHQSQYCSCTVEHPSK